MIEGPVNGADQCAWSFNIFWNRHGIVIFHLQRKCRSFEWAELRVMKRIRFALKKGRLFNSQRFLPVRD
jgi:hypothetical protein